MASKRELQALIVLAGKIDPSLQKALRNAEKQTKNLNKETSLFGKVAAGAWNKVRTAAAVGSAAIGAALVVTAKKGLDLASDLTEVQNVVDVTFGQNANQINAWSKTALKSYGLSELSAKRYSSTLGALMKSSGISNQHLVTMSENLTALSGDFASFHNLKPDEAFEKIKSGISGETEPLKALGINMSVANMEAYAFSKGIKTAWEKMDQAQQTMLRYNYLLEVSKDAQGDFARTFDSYANQRRLFNESMAQMAQTIMSKSLPALTALFQKGNQMLDSLANDPEKIEKLQQVVENVVNKVISGVPIAVKATMKFASAIATVYRASVKTYRFVQDNWSTIKPIILGIVAAMALWKTITLGMATYKGIATGIRIATDAWAWSQRTLTLAKLKDVGATVYLQSLYAKDAIVKAASAASTWYMTAATKAWTIATMIGTGVARAFSIAIAFMTSPIGIVILAIGALIAVGVLLWKNWDKVSSFLANSWEMIKAGFTKGINFIIDKLNSLIEKMNKIPGVEIPLIPKMDTSKYSVTADSQGRASIQMERYAKGGFANKPSIFGEAGPEMAIPLRRTPRSLSLLSQTARALGVGGGNSGGDKPTFVYAPNYGNSPVSESQKRQDFEDFKAMCEEWWESKRRESYDGVPA